MKKTALAMAAVLLAAGTASADLTAVYAFYNDGAATDLDPDTVGEPVFVGTDTRGIEYNPASSEAFPTVVVPDDDANELHVVNAATGALVRTITGFSTGDGTVDPYDVAVSDDGVIFANGFGRSVVYIASDAAGATPTILISGASVNGGTGSSRSIHATGSVAGGTCRVYWSADNNIVVYDVGGTLPISLTATLVDSYATDDGGTALTQASSIAGTADQILLADNQLSVRDVMVVVDGGDTVVPSADDTYAAGDQAIADNQIAQVAIANGIAVLDTGFDALKLGGGETGVYALFEAGGTQDGIAVGSLADAGAAAGIAAIGAGEDQEPDGFWDGGAGNNLNAANLDGGVALGFLNDEVNAWFTSAGANGGFGRLIVTGSVPVELDKFVID